MLALEAHGASRRGRESSGDPDGEQERTEREGSADAGSTETEQADESTLADGRGAAPHVVVYARGSAVGHDHDRESAVVDALESLSADGAVDGYDVRTWPSTVSLRSAGAGRDDVVTEFERFEAWAERRGVSVRPPFVVRHRHSAITQERDEVLVTPTLFLTVWKGDDLLEAYPHCHADGVRTVEDGIGSFFRDRLDGDERAPPTEAPVEELERSQ